MVEINSAFYRCHPIVNLLFFISVTVLSATVHHPAFLLLSFICAAVFDIFLKGRKAVKSLFAFILPMTLVVAAVNVLFNHRGVTVLYTFSNGNNLTLESIVTGFVTGLTVSGVLMWMSCFNVIFTDSKYTYVFGRISPKLSVLLSTAMRFIPHYRMKLREIREVQSVNRNSGNGNFVDKIKSSMKTVYTLINDSLENSIITSDSMMSRGYSLKKKTTYLNYRFFARDIVLSAVMIIADILLIILFSAEKIYASYDPVIKYSIIDKWVVTGVIFYGVMCLLPIIIEITERAEMKISLRGVEGNG